MRKSHYLTEKKRYINVKSKRGEPAFIDVCP